MPFPSSHSLKVASLPALSILFLSCLCLGQANLVGQWNTLPYPMPINPVHAALLHSGKVLVVAGSGGDATSTNYQAAVWDPASGAIVTQPVTWDVFCNGMTILADGRPFIDGGTIQYKPAFLGSSNAGIFDPGTETFTSAAPMSVGRWYPTVITLPDTSVMAFSGITASGNTAASVEVFEPSLNAWTPKFSSGWVPPLYPRLHVLPNGNVFYSGPSGQSRFYFPPSHSWSPVVANTNFTGKRTYGSSVLLPLTPANNYTPVVMIMGGGNPATPTTELIDLSAATPAWQWGPPMSVPRIQMNAVLLPTGKVLALGGSGRDEVASTASLAADLYDPGTNTFSPAGSNTFPRLYHSVALLLPDATVWLAGSNPSGPTYETHMEIYSPSYLFTTDATGAAVPAVRPVISSAPTNIAYGGSFTLSSPDAANISSVTLVKAGAVTHAFNFDQRVVGLSFTTDPATGTITLTGPPNANVAPVGYYMLFLINASGVPSLAHWVQVGSPPTQVGLTLTAQPLSRNVIQGGTTSYSLNTNLNARAESFDVAGLPAGATATFANQNTPATMTVQVASTTVPGTYPLTVRAINGNLSQSATVNLVVLLQGSFTLTASPTSQTVPRGTSATFAIAVAPVNGFHWDVGFKVTGQTAHVTASANPTVVNTSGTTSVTVNVDALASVGTHTLTVVGTSATQSHTAQIQVIVP